MTKKSVCILCNGYGEFNLEASFKKAFIAAGWRVDVVEFDPIIQPYVKFGKVGNVLNRFLPVEPWVRKASREAALMIKELDPSIVLVTGGTTLQLGTLAFIKTYTSAKVVYYWQDPIINLPTNLMDFRTLFDAVASFNKQYVSTFEAMGFKNCFWLPLAADDTIHNTEIDPGMETVCDLNFIGGWRPEREACLKDILKAFPSLDIKVFGTDWKEKCTSKLVLSKTENKAIRGQEFAEFINRSLISLNVIDDAGYPAANMRFFEIPMAGGLQLATYCPEFATDYQDNEDILYFNDRSELFTKITYCLEHKSALIDIRKNAKKKTVSKHLYKNRVLEMIDALGL